MTTVICAGCLKHPAAISEYITAARAQQEYLATRWNATGSSPRLQSDGSYSTEPPAYTPDQFVREQDGTYDAESELFLCTSCYLTNGAPSWRDHEVRSRQLRHIYELSTRRHSLAVADSEPVDRSIFPGDTDPIGDEGP